MASIATAAKGFRITPTTQGSMTRESSKVANGDEKASLFEQHAQTILGMIVLAAIVGSGSLLLALHNDVQVMKTQLNFVNDQIKQGVDDRFRGADWRRESLLIEKHFEEHERRLQKLEDAHQGGVHRMLPPPTLQMR